MTPHTCRAGLGELVQLAQKERVTQKALHWPYEVRFHRGALLRLLHARVRGAERRVDLELDVLRQQFLEILRR